MVDVLFAFPLYTVIIIKQKNSRGALTGGARTSVTASRHAPFSFVRPRNIDITLLRNEITRGTRYSDVLSVRHRASREGIEKYSETCARIIGKTRRNKR